MAAALSDQDVDDASQVGALLDQIEPPIEQVKADGAYDGKPTYQTITAHDDAIAVMIPPRDTAVPSAGFEADPWQEVRDYGQRALVETASGPCAVSNFMVLNSGSSAPSGPCRNVI